MEEELGKWLATLGLGGVLAAFVFWFYRKDSLTHTENWRGQTAIMVETVKENTEAICRLGTLLEALHKRLDIEATPPGPKRFGGTERYRRAST